MWFSVRRICHQKKFKFSAFDLKKLPESGAGACHPARGLSMVMSSEKRDQHKYIFFISLSRGCKQCTPPYLQKIFERGKFTVKFVKLEKSLKLAVNFISEALILVFMNIGHMDG
jgi:hypothetical protein